MTVEKLEMCEFLSEDYAQRASNRGMDYKKSYDSYMQRTQKRSFQLSLNLIELKSMSLRKMTMIVRMEFASFNRTSKLLECIISVF